MIWPFKSQPKIPYIRKKFIPLEDITAYEVAYILPRMSFQWYSNIHFTPQQWASLEDRFKRHFQ